MEKSNYLIIRLLKKVDYSVFCVDNDQKTYYDKHFNVVLPLSSGQQVKRSVVEEMLRCLNLQHAPLVLNYQTNKDKLSQKEIVQPCDPTYYDQLVGGWMSAPSKKGGKKVEGEEEESDTNQYKRRSPLSISAMPPSQPLRASLTEEHIMTFDRTDVPNDTLIVRDEKGKQLNAEEVSAFLEKCNRKIISKRNIISGKNRANGFFKEDIAVDLRKLFRVPILVNDVEISNETLQKLRNEGWTEYHDITGDWLELPKQYHEELAEAIAWSIINWRITSNQSRTFDLMPVLSIAVSTQAHEISNAIRGEIDEIDGKIRGRLVVENNYPDTKIFSTNLLKAYITGERLEENNVETTTTAIEDAAKCIKNAILEYYNSNK